MHNNGSARKLISMTGTLSLTLFCYANTNMLTSSGGPFKIGPQAARMLDSTELFHAY